MCEHLLCELNTPTHTPYRRLDTQRYNALNEVAANGIQNSAFRVVHRVGGGNFNRILREGGPKGTH